MKVSAKKVENPVPVEILILMHRMCVTIVSLLAALCALTLPILTLAELPKTMPASPHPYTDVNSDGIVTPLIYVKGGEPGFVPYEVTAEGYTVQKISGDYKYLEVDEATGIVVDSGLECGKDDPKNKKGKSGKKISKGIKGRVGLDTRRRNILETKTSEGDESIHFARRRAAVVGTKKNLVVPFKFSNHNNRSVPSTSDLNILMNNIGPNANICPTGSVRDVYLKSSFNQLVLDSTVAPWVVLPNTEAYYGNGNSGMSTRAQDMIRDALKALEATGFDFTSFDQDGDGFIDAIAFLHSGYGAEWGGTDSYGTLYTNRIWSHQWGLATKWTSKTGQSVSRYHVSPSLWGTSGSNIGRIGVIAHETGHFFGLPDLYDGQGGSGIGSYCLMANSWGFDGSQRYPPHMSAWSKIQLGWVTPTVITRNGQYSIRQACDYPDIYLINNKFPSKEYLLIENRQKCGMEAVIPGPGLAIFHIDDALLDYTLEGYPGQSGWPGNGKHYRVSLLQADGNYNLELGNNRGDATDLFGATVKSLGPTGTSAGKAYPNTNAYQGGNIINTGISIVSISAPGSTMTFSISGLPDPPVQPMLKPIQPVPKPVRPSLTKPAPKPVRPSPFNAPKPKPVSFMPVKAPSKTPSKKPSRKPSKKPSRKPSKKPSRKPSNKPSLKPVPFLGFENLDRQLLLLKSQLQSNEFKSQASSSADYQDLINTFASLQSKVQGVILSAKESK